MGLFGGGNKQSQTTNVTDTSAGASVAGDAMAAVTSTSVNAGSSSGGTFNFLDAGAIGQSFDFAKTESERGFDFAKLALEKATDGYNTARSDLSDAYSESVTAITAAKEPAEAEVQKQVIYMAAGLLLLVGFIFYTMGKK